MRRAFLLCASLVMLAPGTNAVASHTNRLEIACLTTTGSPLSVELKLRNPGTLPIEVQLTPSMELQSDQGHFWAPFTLTNPVRSLSANARTGLRLGAGESRFLVVQAARLQWARSIDSTWPKASLAERVPPGNYRMEIKMEVGAEDLDFISCAGADIVIPEGLAAQERRTRMEELQHLAVNYRQLRKETHGPATRQVLRHWAGPLHEVMARLGEELGDGSHSEREVFELLGQPDHVKAQGSLHTGISVARGRTHLLYAWRGLHDYLYFVVESGAVLKAQWYFAGE